jgi:hypothetical protein
VLVVLLTVAAVVVVEGLAGVAMFGYAFVTYRPLAERRHTEHDERLGWVNEPQLDVPDMYGPGIGLRTNRQRFRNDRELDATVPAGTTRIICSGDSFTLGYGVSNDQAWCALLAAGHPDRESVNMGQGGYGIDQAYLWYERDGAPLEHDVHLFAFVTEDFKRAGAVEFLGHPKPRLTVVDGRLEVTNVPVPRPREPSSGMSRLAYASRRLSFVHVGSALRRRLSRESPHERWDAEPELREIAAAVIADLKRLNDEAGSVLVLVHLPVEADYHPSHADVWRGFLRERAAEVGCHYVDLVSALRQLPAAEVPPLFIQKGEVDYLGAAGHYSVAGNAMIAAALEDRLTSIPEVAERLGD